MEYKLIQFEEVAPGIGLLTLNRADRLNALSMNMLDELYALFADLQKKPEIRVLIVTGAGRGFCAGADLKDEHFATEEGLALFANASTVLESVQKKFSGIIVEMRRLAQPVIAAVNGPAAGGGMCIALASDIIIACPNATFTASFANIGLSGGELGSTYFLPKMIGSAKASEILLTGRTVDAEEANRIGLVSRLVDDPELMKAAMDTAAVLIGKTPAGLRFTKEALRLNLNAPSVENAIELENRNQSILGCSPDFAEAVASFGKVER